MTERPRGPDAPEAEAARLRRVEPDPPHLAPREAEALAQSVRPLGGSARGATLAALLILVAFVVGLVRPWDLLVDTSTPARPLPQASGAAGPGTPPPDGTGDAGPIASAAGTAPTCGYPQAWRSAVLQTWAGRHARVWPAADVATSAAGPQDPSIPFNVIAGEDFTALGWCAPVSGVERPPVRAQGRLFRVAADGAATEVGYRRLEPPAPSSLGELWVPEGSAASAGTEWPPGRYVIQLAASDGTWERWLGIELRAVSASSEPAPDGPSPTPSALPSSSRPASAPPGDGPPSPSAGPQQTD